MLFFSFLGLFTVNSDESIFLSVSQITYLIQHLRVESQLPVDCGTPIFCALLALFLQCPLVLFGTVSKIPACCNWSLQKYCKSLYWAELESEKSSGKFSVLEDSDSPSQVRPETSSAEKTFSGQTWALHTLLAVINDTPKSLPAKYVL